MPFRILVATIFLFLIAGLQMAQATSTLEPYRTDGCSVPKGFSRETWTDCCTAHDFSYWMGGSLIDKRRADAQLVSCISSKGIASRFAAKIFELLPERFSKNHWGSKWHPARPNQELTEGEIKQVEQYMPSFDLKLPIVKNLTGHSCRNIIIQKVNFATILSSQDRLTCFDLKLLNQHSKLNEQLVYSDRCGGYFLVTTDGPTQDLQSIEAYGECASVLRNSSRDNQKKLQGNCKLAQPTLHEFFDILSILETENQRM